MLERHFLNTVAWINWQHHKVLLAITRCRTAALGGHRDQCSDCGHVAISYNSCRNRHCPRCQGNARLRWLQARERELLPTRYVHAVFTLPRELAPLALQNKRVIYNLLFHASAETLLEVARDPRHLGAEIGFFSVLHSWNQRLQFHPHVHCVLAAGGLAPDHSRWISARRSFFLPIKVLSRVFRGKFVAGLQDRLPSRHTSVPRQPPAPWPSHVPSQHGCEYCSATTGWSTPSAPSVDRNMSCAIWAPTPIASPSPTTGWSLSPTGNVTFRWRDSAHGNKKRLMTLPVEEFLRRFLLHVLPRGFVRIRHFGFLANRQRAILLPLCFQLLHAITEHQLLHRHRRPPTSLSRFGTVQSAVEPCTSSNGSPRLNSCFALHLTPERAQHEPLSTSSASARAPARTEIRCLVEPGVLYYLFFQPMPNASVQRFAASPATSKRQIIPTTAAYLNICTCSPPFKVHSLPPGRLPSSRCIRSARPRIMRLPTVPRRALQIQH